MSTEHSGSAASAANDNDDRGLWNAIVNAADSESAWNKGVEALRGKYSFLARCLYLFEMRAVFVARNPTATKVGRKKASSNEAKMSSFHEAIHNQTGIKKKTAERAIEVVEGLDRLIGREEVLGLVGWGKETGGTPLANAARLLRKIAHLNKPEDARRIVQLATLGSIEGRRTIEVRVTTLDDGTVQTEPSLPEGSKPMTRRARVTGPDGATTFVRKPVVLTPDGKQQLWEVPNAKQVCDRYLQRQKEDLRIATRTAIYEARARGGDLGTGYRNAIKFGDVLTRIREIPDGVVQCIVTSPPFPGLRDYGYRHWIGGDPNCEHDRGVIHQPRHPGQVPQSLGTGSSADGGNAETYECSKCGAWYGQLGLEPTIERWLKTQVAVFAECMRVLRDDGLLFVECGDTFNTGATTERMSANDGFKHLDATMYLEKTRAKNKLGVPWRLALALQADGWNLRQDIIWHKVSCLPESVRDRPTTAHSYIFMFSKSDRYYYDATIAGKEALTAEERNLRSVWTFPREVYRGAHPATFPLSLAKRCIALSSAPGDLVLDPYAGSGTTLAAAKALGREYVGIEINERDYGPLILERLDGVNESNAIIRPCVIRPDVVRQRRIEYADWRRVEGAREQSTASAPFGQQHRRRVA